MKLRGVLTRVSSSPDGTSRRRRYTVEFTAFEDSEKDERGLFNKVVQIDITPQNVQSQSGRIPVSDLNLNVTKQGLANSTQLNETPEVKSDTEGHSPDRFSLLEVD